jgi:hypothetical protein
MNSAKSDNDIDSPPMSDDEYQSNKKNHGSGPVKLYLKETFSNWPKDRYQKYRESQMKKHGIPMNYGSIHTKEIRYTLKHENNQRKKDENTSNHLRKTTEDLPNRISFLSLDPENVILPIQIDRRSRSSIKTTNENEQKTKRSRSRLRTMKDKFKKTLKRTTNDTNHLAIDTERVEITSDNE